MKLIAIGLSTKKDCIYSMKRKRRENAPIPGMPCSIYMDSVIRGGAACWWCSEICIGPCTPMPTLPSPPWGLVGFFCCVGCAKAYMLQRGFPVSYLKLYIRKYSGVPFSCPLPCSPPWQTLAKYGPPAGVLSYEEFRKTNWGTLKSAPIDVASLTSMPTRMGRHEVHSFGKNALVQKASKKEITRIRPRRMKVAEAACDENMNLEMLSRKGPKSTGGILSFFTHTRGALQTLCT
jgi:hypothetical protein